MRYGDIIKVLHENDSTDISSIEEAEAVLNAFLETLGESLGEPDQFRLAAELPEGLKEVCTRRREQQPLNLEEFYKRVGARSGERRYGESVRVSQAAAHAVRKAVSSGEIEKLLSVLPDEFEELFTASERGPLSATTENNRR